MNPAVIEVMKLAEENARLRQIVSAQEAVIEGLQRELASSMRPATPENYNGPHVRDPYAPELRDDWLANALFGGV